MDKEQIQEWLDAGMNIGSHSLSHKDLTKISNNDVIDLASRNMSALLDGIPPSRK